MSTEDQQTHSQLDGMEPDTAIPADTPRAVPVTDSGRWDRWEDVPDDVTYRGTHDDGSPHGGRWVNRGGQRFIELSMDLSLVPEHMMVRLAPFVPVGGHQA
ncbi:hypothetical protein M2280_005275 [Prescottella agglutinans]|uniref:Uncharacterized protein n=1 Tax=Prescottella agglutinans TaxID=1644129 RepID=A0ABT6MJG0_9NOCA|nr:hypothetical protein [Prescottella agglutinans]